MAPPRHTTLAFLALLAACAAAPLGGPAAPPLINDLRVEGLVAPLAAPPRPRFSWRATGAQRSYRLTVTQTYPTTNVAWDSGVVNSSASWLVPCGADLPADSDFTWTVALELAGSGAASASAPLSTAPRAAPAGAWLGFADTLRGALALSPAPVARARLLATGVGCYEARVNGARVSAALAPGFGHAPSARALYDTYDVAAALQPGGENVVGVRVGSCKWGAFGQYCAGGAAACNAAWAALVVDQGGNVTTLVTSGGAAWRAANTSVLYQHLWNGELYDARLEQPGWAEPHFANASAWAPATPVDTADRIGPLLPALAPPVALGAPLTPASVTAVPGAAFVFDLGANIAGFCGLDLAPPAGEARVAAGAALSLLHGELLHPNGTVYNHYLPPGGTHQPGGLNQPQMNYSYVTRGADELMHGPHFSFFGFRFIELRGWPYAAPPAPAALTCSFIHTDLPATGTVSFPGQPALDALQNATVRTHLSNYVRFNVHNAAPATATLTTLTPNSMRAPRP